MIIEAKEKELKKKRDDILNAKKSYDGNDPLTLSKKIKNLDMKLEKLRQKHNEALADNVQLRDKINSLRSEKNIFDKIHDKLSLELKQKDEDYDRLKKESEKAKIEIYSVKKNLDEARKTVFKEQKDLEKEYQSIYDLLNRENRDDRIKDTRE